MKVTCVPLGCFFLFLLRTGGLKFSRIGRPSRCKFNGQARAARLSMTVRNPRPVRSSTQPARLPVWPAWNGIAFILLDLLKQHNLAAKLEDWLGGRVCPMMLDTTEADPFILLVHHRHSFQRFDPLRAAFRLLMAEGFPAHPHRGFETVTYVLPGKRGLVHRDSLGLKMRYSDGEAQWMTAGRGILHEEMWETDANEEYAPGNPHAKQSVLPAGVSDMRLTSDAELYQLWLNLPPAHKMTEPRVQLLSPPDERVERRNAWPPRPSGIGGSLDSAPRETLVRNVDLPSVWPGPGICVRVLSGEAHGVKSDTKTFSPVTILHVTLSSDEDENNDSSSLSPRAGVVSSTSVCWELPLPASFTCLIYVRHGAIAVPTTGFGDSDSRTHLKTHSLSYLERNKLYDGLRLELLGADDADIMIFAGEPIDAPVASSGTFVMNSNAELEEAFNDYQRGAFGIPWDYSLSDQDWRKQLKK